MSKEIFEQSITIKKCLSEYTDSLKKDINIYNFPIEPKKINKIVLIGCGTGIFFWKDKDKDTNEN